MLNTAFAPSIEFLEDLERFPGMMGFGSTLILVIRDRSVTCCTVQEPVLYRGARSLISDMQGLTSSRDRVPGSLGITGTGAGKEPLSQVTEPVTKRLGFKGAAGPVR